MTGAAGFIGSNLSAYLLAQGARVVGFDNMMTGTPENISRVQALSADRFHFIEGDILDADAIFQAANKCDCVAHLAAQVSVQRSLDDILETNSINIKGFLNTYDAALKGGACQFIYASSCAVYGDNHNLPLNENALPAPLSPYAVSKLTNEYYADVLTRQHPKMAATGLRFFNIYGPWQDSAGGYAAVIPKWIASLLKSEQAIIFGDGSATRDFCFVDDLCAAILNAAKFPKRTSHSIYNVASGTQISMMELYKEIVVEMSHIGIQIPFNSPLYQAHRDGDILHSYADVDQITKDLKFHPKVNLAQGIAMILKHQYSLSQEIMRTSPIGKN